MLHRLGVGAALAVLGLGAFAGPAFAHAPSFSRVTVTIDTPANTIAVTVQLTPPDRDSDGQISAAEYAGAREFLHANSAQWLTLRQGSLALPLAAGEFNESFAEKTLAWTTRVIASTDASGASASRALSSLEIPVISRLGEGHRAYVEVRRDGKLLADALLSRSEPALELPGATDTRDDAGRSSSGPSATVRGSTSFAPSDSAVSSGPSSARALSFFKLGLEHILTGYDHLLFLAGLILVCRKFRDFIAVVTSFTLAHSVTLGLSALGGVRISPAVIEPLIAASIVVVGIENLVLRGAEPKRRWMPAFAFGLIHGFGFAGALSEAGFGSGLATWVSLATFNLGVEAGQLALVLIALPVLAWLRKQPRMETTAVQFASAAVVACGAFWCAQRLGA